MPHELGLLLLFVVATGVAILARAWRVPYTVALVLVGLGLGATRLVTTDLLRRDLLFAIFLPALVFEAAYHLDARELVRRACPVLALAVPGVAITAWTTAAILAGARPALGFAPALVFGAIVAATDPIAVVALFRALGAPRPLAVLVESESLLNDATAVVLVTLTVGVAAGASPSLGAITLSFARILGIGAVVGALVGFVASAVSRRLDDAMIEVTLTVIAAFGSFAVAERLGGSGVLACLAAGLVTGTYGEAGMSPPTRHAVSIFWEYAAFAANSLVFLSMGAAVRLGALAASAGAVLAAYVAVLVARALLVGGVGLAFRRTRAAIPWRWSVVLVWGGVRGALSMVLALALPATFPHRDELVTLTYGVTLLTVVVQGLTIGPLLRRLGLGARPSPP